MASPPPPASEPSPGSEPIPDRSSPPAELPLTLASSLVLTSLPRDATAALAAASAAAAAAARDKVTVRFKAVGAAPALRQQVYRITASQRFEVVVAFLRRLLRCAPSDSLFCYVNSSFAPALDELVGNLDRCFASRAQGELLVAYAMTPAFG
jgi:ubiquitin-like protein ATG12